MHSHTLTCALIQTNKHTHPRTNTNTRTHRLRIYTFDLFVPRARTAMAKTRALSCLHWPCTMEPASSFDTFLFINWWAKCLFSLSEDLFLFSGSFALAIGVHCERRYIN